MKHFIRIVALLLSIALVGFVALSIMSQVKQRHIVKTYYDALTLDVQYVDINETAIAYRTFGDPNNAVLLFIHGFLGSSHDFDAVFPWFDAYYVVAIDLPGFGLSEKDPSYGYSKENQAQTVIAFIEHQDLTAVTLIGHSMGGEIALRVVNQRPELVKELILIASAGLETPSSRQSLPTFFYTHILNNYYLQRFAFRGVYHDASFATNANFDPMYFFTHQIPSRVFQEFSNDEDTLFVSDFIETIERDALLVWGRQDTWVPLSRGESMLSLLPHAQLVILDEAGHLPFDEQLEDFINALLTFLERND